MAFILIQMHIIFFFTHLLEIYMNALNIIHFCLMQRLFSQSVSIDFCVLWIRFYILTHSQLQAAVLSQY